jgi:hypothetical protein
MRSLFPIATGFRHVVEVGLQALLIVAIVVTLLLALAPVYKPADFLSGANDADARSRYTGSLRADPDTVQAGDHFDVVGCNYDTDLGNVIVSFTGGSWGSELDSDGCFRIEHIPALSGDTLAPGTYEISARQKVGKRWRETGETYIKVVR